MKWTKAAIADAPRIRILLLTNNDSDNVGDQIIEQSVVSLIKAAVKNLGYPLRRLEISSRAIGMISQRYLSTRDDKHLAAARREVAEADVVIFGGAPVFNYRYQNFYLKTITLIELAQEYGVPVLFSSVGVEPFDASDERSVALQRALALPCVRQATTRDDLESLRAYISSDEKPVSLVSDPAVVADVVFGTPAAVERDGETTTIGLVVTRSGLFRDNGIPFSVNDQCQMWLSIIAGLKARGYDYRLFTTGHFADEVVLDALVRTGRVAFTKSRIAVNSPEELVEEIAGCDAVIAYRLHASITAFAYDIPSIGLSWNFKVPAFYDSIGYPERALSPERWVASEILSALDIALGSGVVKDESLTMSVYRTLFDGLKSVLDAESDQVPYSYAQLMRHLPRYEGTSTEAYRAKMQRKLRRVYQPYGEKIAKLNLFK